MKFAMKVIVGAVGAYAAYLIGSVALNLIATGMQSAIDDRVRAMRASVVLLDDVVRAALVPVLVATLLAVVVLIGGRLLIRLLIKTQRVNQSQGRSLQHFVFHGNVNVGQIGQGFENRDSTINVVAQSQQQSLANIEVGLHQLQSTAVRDDALGTGELKELLSLYAELEAQVRLSGKERNRRRIAELFSRIPVLLSVAHSARQAWADWAPPIAKFLGIHI
jgi:hypothetical protein